MVAVPRVQSSNLVLPAVTRAELGMAANGDRSDAGTYYDWPTDAPANVALRRARYIIVSALQ